MIDYTNTKHILLIIMVCFLFTFFITFYIKKIAYHIKALDIPDKRKVHTKPMPRLGGLGIFLGFLFGYILFGRESIQMNSILIGGFIIVMIGVIDDISPLQARTKLVAQIAAALVIIFYGNILMEHVTFLGLDIHFGIFSSLITLIFVLGCINMINLIDGLDGLSSGTCAIFYLTIGIIAYMNGSVGALSISLTFIMLGCTLGFLYHNFYPATIFSGDSGSMFQGFMVAVISLLKFKTAAMISLVVPLLILGIPIMDTLFAIIRRALKHEKIYMPDKLHLHHQLLTLGLSHRNTVLAIYLMNILFASASIIYILKDSTLGAIVYIILFTLIVWLILRTTIITEKKIDITKPIRKIKKS